MDFERYRVPASARDGVWIELPGTQDAKFLVALPSEHNRAYNAALQRAMPIALGEDARPEIGQLDFVEWQAMRVEAFLVHCVREMPEGMTADQLRTDFYPGLLALFTRASDLAAEESRSAVAQTKKSKA
jgi:hypothetical protein